MNIDTFAFKLYKMRGKPSEVLPDREEVERFAGELLNILFPHFEKRTYSSDSEIEYELKRIEDCLKHILEPLRSSLKESGESMVEKFFATIPLLHDKLILDAEAIYQGDPAAESMDEVIMSYPGFYAIAIYRIAHEFYKLQVPFFPRILTEFAHRRTGIDIHPGATIGDYFFIDHGTGVVIGETTLIGSNVKIYQGVTLGALSVEKRLSNTKRHPTIEDNVIIYSGATILGGNTIIGHDTIVGGNVWLTNSVPAHSLVYHKSQIRVRSTLEEVQEIDFTI